MADKGLATHLKNILKPYKAIFKAAWQITLVRFFVDLKTKCLRQLNELEEGKMASLESITTKIA
jgi:hypothetical protein